MLGLELLVAADLTAAGLVVTETRSGGGDDGYGVLFRAGRGGVMWGLGAGAEEDADPGTIDRYFEEIVDALAPAADTTGLPGSERLSGLGDDAIYSDGWLYVKRRTRVFWIFAEGGDDADAATLTRQLAAVALKRLDALPPPATSRSVVTAPGARPRPPATPPPPPRTHDERTGTDPAPILRPVDLHANYARGGLEHVSLRIEHAALVAVDAGGREHRFRLDAGDAAPASIGVVFRRPGLLRELFLRQPVNPAFVVLDRARRPLVTHRDHTIWPEKDLRRFAAAAGLVHLPYGPAVIEKNAGVVRLHRT